MSEPPKRDLYDEATQVAKSYLTNLPETTENTTRLNHRKAEGSGAKLLLDGNGITIQNEHNVAELVANHPDFARFRVWYNSFSSRIIRESDGIEWSDADSVSLQVKLQSSQYMKRIGIGIVDRAIAYAASLNKRDPPQDHATACRLRWDGTKRLESFFPDAFGIPQTPYTASVGKALWISLADRIMNPGCKADYMVVMESEVQGRLKSTFCRELVKPEWFAEINTPIDSPKFVEEIQGKVVIETPELQCFKQSTSRFAIRSGLSIRTDRARFSYARFAADYPRRCIFVGTTNQKEHLVEDERRILPIDISGGDFSCAIEYLIANREQYLGEAVTRIGECYWDIPDAEAERSARIISDTWTDRVATMNVAQVGTRIGDGLRYAMQVTTGEVLEEVFDIKVGKQTKSDQLRVSKALKQAGWLRLTVWHNGGSAKVWRLYY
jgi:putative DNA primase/helicase